MNNTTDTFEAIAKDAVVLLTAIVADLAGSEDDSDLCISVLIGKLAEELCNRAIALGAE